METNNPIVRENEKGRKYANEKLKEEYLNVLAKVDPNTVETTAINLEDVEQVETNDEMSDVPDIDQGFVKGFKWVSRLPQLSQNTLIELKMVWSNLVMELVCRRVKIFNQLLNYPIPDLERYGTGRPDFVTESKVFEIKAFIGKPLPDTINERLAEVINAYAGKKKIHIIVVVADDMLPSKIRMKPKEAKIYRLLRNRIRAAKRQFKELFTEKEYQEYEDVADFSDIFNEFQFKPWHNHEDFIQNGNVRSFEAMEKRILNHTPIFAEWLKGKTIEIKSLVDLAFDKLPKQNISKLKPLDRDYNRTTLNTVYGHSGKQMQPMILVNEHPVDSVEAALEEVKVPIWSDLYHMYKSNFDIVSKVREMNRVIALLSTDTAPDVYEFISKKYGGNHKKFHKTRKYLKEIVGNLIEERRSKLASSGSDLTNIWHLKKNGAFRLINQRMQKKLKVGNWEKTETVKPIDERDFALFDDDWERKLGEFYLNSKWKINIPTDLKDVYSFNEKSADLLKQIHYTSSDYFKSMKTDPTFRMLYSNMKFARDLIMGVPQSTSKYSKTNDFFVVESTECSTIIFCSVNPNENTSGIISFAQVVDKDTGQLFVDDKIFGMWDVYPLKNGLSLVVSKPFRSNMKAIAQMDGTMGAYAGAQALWYSRHDGLLQSPLWKSFFWSFTRQLVNVSDFIYVLLTRATSDISFGKDDITTKFKTLEFKDARVGQVLQNAKTFYPEFVQKYQTVREGTKFKEVIIDPFFQIPMETKDDLWFLDYTKQALHKDDGFDPAKLAYGFFDDDCNDQMEWSDNPFNSKNNDSLKFSFEDFTRNLYKAGNKWVNSSFCPEFIMSATREAYSKYKGKFIRSFLDEISSHSSVDDLAHSKVNSSPLFEFCKHVAGNYAGLASVQLPEAILWDIHMLRNEKNEYETYIGGKRISSKLDPTMGELALFDIFRHPQQVLLVPHNKVQTGYGKRQFYEMTIYGRNINVAVDTGFRPILAIFPQDMILKSGDEKLIDVQKIINKLVKRFGVSKLFISSEDQKRFGDTYPLESFDCVFEACYRVGLLTDKEREFCSHAIKGMWGRIHVMPHYTQKIMRDGLKTNSKESAGLKTDKPPKRRAVIEKVMKSVTEKMNFFYEVIKKSGKDFGKIGTQENFKEFSQAFVENIGMQKDVGFALGVFNIISTFLSCLNCFTVEDIMERLIGEKGVVGKSHSDDGIKISILPSVNKAYFDAWIAQESIDFANWGERFSIDRKSSQWIAYVKRDDQELTKKRDLRELTCIFICITLFVPRLIGQRPSLLKWFFGADGEVLQVCYDEDGSHVPLIRHVTPLLRDLPGKSFASDLVSACSRVLPVLQYGGDATLSHILLIMSNFLVRTRFGLESIEVRWDTLPQTFGGWYALPHELLEFGFEANNIRLMAMAQTNRYTHRILTIMMMTRELWSIGGGTDVKELAELGKEIMDSGLESENSNFGKVIIDDNFDRVGDTWVDPKITFTRFNKTLKSYEIQLDAYKQDIMDAERIIQKDFSLPIRKLKDEDEKNEKVLHSATLERKNLSKKIRDLDRDFTLLYLYEIKTYSTSLVRHLKKYTNPAFQESYIRIPLSKKLINRLGYPKRLMSNPFKAQLKALNNKRIITISEMIQTVFELAQSDIKLPAENELMFNFYLSLFQKAWNNCLNRRPTFKYELMENDDRMVQIAKLDFRRIRRELSDVLLNFRPKEVIGYIIETVGDMKPKEKTLLFTTKPSLLFDSNFISVADSVAKFFSAYKGKAEVLIKNSQILVRLLSTIVRPIIMKASGDQVHRNFYTDRGMNGFIMHVGEFTSSTIMMSKPKFQTNKENISFIMTQLAISALQTEKYYKDMFIKFGETLYKIDPIYLLDELSSMEKSINIFDVNTIISTVIAIGYSSKFITKITTEELLNFTYRSVPDWFEILRYAELIQSCIVSYGRLTALIMKIKIDVEVNGAFVTRTKWCMIRSDLDEFQTVVLFAIGFYSIEKNLKQNVNLELMSKLLFNEKDNFWFGGELHHMVGDCAISRTKRGFVLVRSMGTIAIKNIALHTLLIFKNSIEFDNHYVFPWTGDVIETINMKNEPAKFPFLLTPWRIFRSQNIFKVFSKEGLILGQELDVGLHNEFNSFLQNELEFDPKYLIELTTLIIMKSRDSLEFGNLRNKYLWASRYLSKPEFSYEKKSIGMMKSLDGEMEIVTIDVKEEIMLTKEDYNLILAKFLNQAPNKFRQFILLFYLEFSTIVGFDCIPWISKLRDKKQLRRGRTMEYWDYLSEKVSRSIVIQRACIFADTYEFLDEEMDFIRNFAALSFKITDGKDIDDIFSMINSKTSLDFEERDRLTFDYLSPLNLSVDLHYNLILFLFKFEDICDLLFEMNVELDYKLFWMSRSTLVYRKWVVERFSPNIRQLFLYAI